MFTPNISPLTSNEDCEFAKFFKQLGYRYSWDFSKCDGLHWHELYKDDKLRFQCEMGVPLQKVIDDMCVEEDFKTDYFIASDEDSYTDLIKAVREFTGHTWKTRQERDKYYSKI